MIFNSLKGACSIPKKKLIQLFIIIPIAALALLYGSGYLSQLFSNYRAWQEADAVFGTSPAFPDAGFVPCLAAAFHFPYGLYGLGLCIGALALLILMVMRMGYSEGGEYDRRRNLVYSNKGTYGTAGFMSRKELTEVLDLVPDIRKVDDALVDTVTTDKNGRVFVPLKDGSYYAKEVTSNKSFRLDDTPHYFEIKDGKHVTLQVTNKKLSGIVIHKIDSATGEGIYGVKFVLYDANKKPIGEYTSDDEGYIYIDEIPGGLSGRFYLRELEAAPGYTLDKQYKTVYVSPGKTVEIEWENTAVTGQIQIYKYAAEYNEVTGTAAGTPLKGAVYEIVNARSGKVVDYITTDARGVAASKPLPLTRYQIREVTAPAYWQLDPTVHDVTLEYPGQIIKLSAYDKPASLGVTITKRGNAQVMAGQSMRYDLTVANTSNVPLESFFWHDKIPYDVARPTTLTTGTYSARLNYRILYKTNYNVSYQVLASNLLTNNNYSFSLNAIPMQAGEVVTDIYFDFGKVPVGFQSVVNPTLSVMVNGNAVNGYQMVNRADVGGKYQGTWQTATASWVTIIRRLWNTPTLPKTGY